ncbi:phosphatidylinositol 3-kinase catalytic subunit type 3-like [Uloborus diversus]|uniref:phosphatidylinositol 3-kinase catalytic subunit type 3-like n=1 Tax=Uloborus diversus TaxID=327109 RepID=UPI00240A006E|nr:phosphatidylinositol 3-kinase catalytic subunit type 3-like [Uloborus diversus]
MTATEEPRKRFNYIYSCNMGSNFRIKIGTLEGKPEKPNYRALINDPILKYSGLSEDKCSDLYVTCQVYADNKPLAFPTQTSYKPFTTRWNWNEWLVLPVKFCELPRNALLAFTVWDIYGPNQSVPVGGATVSVFGKYGALRQGMHDLRLWNNVEADGNLNTKTPGKTDCAKEQMNKLSKLTKKHRNGHMIKVDWLDRLTFREIELINEMEKRSSNFMFLMIEFPTITANGAEYTVVYFEEDGDDPCQGNKQVEIVMVPDPEISTHNLVEAKHHKLARSIRSGPSDKDLKPNAATRDQLNAILHYPPTKSLSSEEQDLIWKFRFYLTSQKKALTKFLKCVNWKIQSEEKQALDLLARWQAMDVEDALELLSPQYTHPLVRKYAVTRLNQAPDEDLLMYLLQLVQALKYENFAEIRKGLSLYHPESEDEIERDRALSSSSSEKGDTYADHLKGISSVSSEPNSLEEQFSSLGVISCDLATFLINRACANETLANYFYWYLLIEVEEPENAAKDARAKEMYEIVMKRFNLVLQNGSAEYRKRRHLLVRGREFVEKLLNLLKTVARESGGRRKKIEKLQAYLYDKDIHKINFLQFEPLPLPLDPCVKVKGIIPEKTTLFKSALMPARLTFLTVDDKEYVTIFKLGDDLRQDQLILQTISLMDKLLRKENLDLRLTPYSVLACSSKHGFVRYIESMSINSILDEHKDIQSFLREHAPSENGPYWISHEVMDTYVKSCAGYCIITYLLGVGDRHLDNLLMTKNGKLFHIDFGYILGRDPKPLPPPMKLSKEMVEAMGGIHSEHYQEFRKQCYTAFLHLRRHANLILNLFSLMVDASVPDIALEPDKTVKKVQDKFRLDLPDEEAVHFIQNIIDESVTAVMPVVVEQIHRIAQYWRR